MTKRILWELKCTILSFEEDVNKYFANNENTNYKKSYTPCYAPVIVLEGSRSFVRDG